MKRLIIIIAMALMTLTGLTVLDVEAQTGATAVVTAWHLNVRDYPDPNTGPVIARVGRGEVYNVLARSSFNHWWQLQLADGRAGWVNGNYIIVYNQHLVPTINPGSPPPPASAEATVTTGELNVRTIPDPNNGAIMTTIRRNQVYPVIGRNANSSWWQLRLPDNRTGWVNGNYISVVNAHLVPQTDQTTPPPSGSAVGTVTSYYLNVRTVPNADIGQVITVIARGESYPVVGRLADMSWWLIRLPDGRTGWVSDRYLAVVNYQSVPVVDGGVTPPPPATVNGVVTAYFLNVRSIPNPTFGTPIAVISRGQVYQAIGRNASSTWWQIRLGDGRTGWVSGGYFAVNGGGGLPVTG